MIDTTFNFYSDATGPDPDSSSPTLRRYHRLLWSKELPNGKPFTLSEERVDTYLYHTSGLGEFFLSSDGITNSYGHHKRKKEIAEQIPEAVKEVYDVGSTIGGYIIFPYNRVEGLQTINQTRGRDRRIDDRFDLTLECIRRYYLGEESPLYPTLLGYKSFFDLFEDFSSYVRFFFLDDLLDEDGNVRFCLPFDNFNTQPGFRTTDEYLAYAEWANSFVIARNGRIAGYISQKA